MGNLRKRIKYNEVSEEEVHYNTMYGKSLYGVEYPGRTMEKLTDNIISENMLLRV